MTIPELSLNFKLTDEVRNIYSWERMKESVLEGLRNVRLTKPLVPGATNNN